MATASAQQELSCKCCGDDRRDPRFTIALAALHAAWDGKWSVLSACRCNKRNMVIAGDPKSLHLTNNISHPEAKGCMAIDLRWFGWDWQEQLRFARFAYANGWSIKLGHTLVHLDRRVDLGIEQYCWYYPDFQHDFHKQDIVR